MRLLVLTNIYPPQELGGYGRAMADFVWSLKQLGHNIQVICGDESYLGASEIHGPSGETVSRILQLKGTYKDGVKPLENITIANEINRLNIISIQSICKKEAGFQGVLVGNLDLLGLEVLQPLLQQKIPILHHIGFVNPPFAKNMLPKEDSYQMVAASKAVADALKIAGLINPNKRDAAVVYPGVRCELFGREATGRSLPAPLNGMDEISRLGTPKHPLKVCFAGLLMGSKGAHTLIQALILMKQRGFWVQGYLAGASFQAGYREQLEIMLKQNDLADVQFIGQLSRNSLARCFSLHHVCVFPSIYPEAFGIVAAEAMASGLALVSSGVGGACELFEDKSSGLLFKPNDINDLAAKLELICANTSYLKKLAKTGEAHARSTLNVLESAKNLEQLMLKSINELG